MRASPLSTLGYLVEACWSAVVRPTFLFVIRVISFISFLVGIEQDQPPGKCYTSRSIHPSPREVLALLPHPALTGSDGLRKSPPLYHSHVVHVLLRGGQQRYA